LSLTCLMPALIVGCASAPRYIQPTGDVAYLQNRIQYYRQARFIYFFEFANGLDISAKEFAMTAPAKARASIYPGETVVGVKIVYTPAYSRNVFGRGNDRMYYIYARDLGMTDDRLAFISENAPDVDVARISGLKGLRFRAEAGHTYQVASRIENGRAYIWIEEPDGNAVSDTVLGVADPGCIVQTALEVGLANCMPDLRNGWTVLDELPDPLY